MAAATPAWAAGGTILGEWSGRYDCAQGITGVRVVITEASPHSASALFHFFAVPENPDVPEGCFTLQGTYDGASLLALRGDEWLLRPRGYVTVDVVGQIDPAGKRFVGRVIGPGCSTFELLRGAPLDRAIPDACQIDERIAGGFANSIADTAPQAQATAVP